MWGTANLSDEQKKLLDETAGLRKELHEKKFDFREAWRAGDKDKAEAIEKQIDDLRDKLSAKLGPESGKGYGRGYGRGYCQGPYGQ